MQLTAARLTITAKIEAAAISASVDLYQLHLKRLAQNEIKLK